MSTPKDVPYKQRQVEFKKLNKGSYSVKKGNWTVHDMPVLTLIVLKEQIDAVQDR